jgi:nucleoside phosphorylase
MPFHGRPRSREEFEIAVICALRIESDAVEALFDEFWEEDDTYGKAPGDPNAYTTGRIGGHDVVLAFTPGMGKGSAAGVAASFRSSFPHIKLGLVVGICGGVPIAINTKEEIILGDVIVSTGLVQFDFGRQYLDKVVRKDTLQDNLGRPNNEIRAFLAKMAGLQGQKQLKKDTFTYLAAILAQEDFENSKYPGLGEDKLYKANYRHMHQDRTTCSICALCTDTVDPTCDVALESSCVDLKCDDNQQVNRDRVQKSKQAARLAVNGSATGEQAAMVQKPLIHFGRIASGDLVMKSGHHRDDIAAREKVIAFEMEGAGVWDNFPTVVIKGVCDYADSHKNKKWQKYAAATAAACTKALLKRWRVADKLSRPSADPSE